MTGSGTIFGRSPNLVLGFLTAAFNLAVAFAILGFAPTVDQVAVVNTFLGAIVLLIANIPELTVGAGVKAINQLNNAAPGAATPGTDLANQIANGDGIQVSNVASGSHP